MSRPIDRLNPEHILIATEVRDPDRSIGTLASWEIVRSLESASHHPIHAWSFYIDGREMDDPCELCRREKRLVLRHSFRDTAIYSSFRTTQVESCSLGIREDMET